MVNMNNFLKQAQAMQKKMLDAQEKLNSQEFEGESGGGMVKVSITGNIEMRKVTISPELINKDDVEILEDLIVAAFNDAKKRVDENSQSNLSNLMGDMKMPAGFKMPF
jgi:nucleoid-associated protein EbfC